MTITKDLGAVSAYAYAVEKGYTGTEEEYSELMASYASVAEEATESAESAQASATTANSAASTATNKASEATTAAQTATAKAEEAQADADAAALDASQALSAASTATSKASEAAQSASDAVTAKTAAQTAQTAAEGSATTAQTAAQTATQKAAEAAESARTLTIDPTLTQSGQAADAKVVGDEIGELKSAVSEIIDATENIIDYNQSNFKQFTNYTGTYTATSDGFTFSKGESANFQIGLFFPVIVGHTYKLSYHVSSGVSAQSYVMRNADYPNKLSAYIPEYAYNDNYASESGNDYTVTFTAVTNPECVLAFRISYSAPTDFTLTDLICIDTAENVKVYPEVLPFATNVQCGAVVVGNGLSISGEGVLSIDSSITQEINEIETDVDLIENVAVQKVYPVNVLDVSSESFGRSTSGQNWNDSLSIIYNENNGFRATISEYLNIRWWYLFNTQSGKTYDVSCETSGMNSGCTLKIMKNYNTPASPGEYSEDYVVATLADDRNGKYTGSFTANSDQYMFVIYKRYDSRDLTVTNVKCTDQTDIERYEMKIADSGSVGGIRIGSGLSITGNGIMSVDKTANIPTKYDGRDFCVFNKCLCIGDSLTQGVFNHNEGGSNQTVVISKYSYPSILTKMSGVETTNLGNGGYTSEGWYGLHENDDLSGHDVCIIALGTNDAAKGLSSGTTQSWIQSIITKVKSQNKGIKIFVSNLLPAMKYNTQAYTDVNNYIAAVVQANTNCYLLDMTQYSACQRGTPYAQEHLTAIGYRQEAEEIMNYIGYIMQGNESDFRNVQFAGTNYDWDDD